MKRKNYKAHIEIFISDGGHACSACKHDRKGEPYAIFFPSSSGDWVTGKAKCWLCCHDAESTFMIKQKWPLAFDRYTAPWGWILQWSHSIKSLVGENEKA